MQVKHIFFTVLVVFLWSVPSFAGLGLIDHREYVKDWSVHPFNKYLEMCYGTEKCAKGMGGCTAQWVGPDLILTADHCIESDINYFRTYDDRLVKARLEKRGGYFEGDKENPDKVDADWAIYRLVDPLKDATNDWFDIEIPESGTILTVDNIGWGGQRIMTTDEMQKIVKLYKEAFEEALKKNKDLYYRDFVENVLKDLKDSGIAPVFESPTLLKMHKGCTVITDESCFSENLNYGIIEEYMGNYGLKCGIYAEKPQKFPRVLPTTCDTVGGNSGGAYLHNGKIVGIESGGFDSIAEWDDTDEIVSSYVFSAVIADALEKSPKVIRLEYNEPSAPASLGASSQSDTPAQNDVPVVTETAVAEQSADVAGVPAYGMDDETDEEYNARISKYDLKIEALEQQIQQAMSANVDNLNEAQIINNIMKMYELDYIQKLRDNAQKMKDKEQSTANKLLGGAAIGATGIGAMNLASGLAEQKADSAAEEDMKAYLATFVCDYGQGRNIKGGETNIDLPGGNDLFAAVNEYRALAADLKIRKEALGKQPGIESEVIIDAADTGLYDNVGLGRQSGAYTSLSRALTDETSKDAEEWAKQKADTASKVKTGAITAAAGAIGGMIGNLAINSGKDKQNKSDEITAEYKKNIRDNLTKNLSPLQEQSVQDLRNRLEELKNEKSAFIEDYRTESEKACERGGGFLSGNDCVCVEQNNQIWNKTRGRCELPPPSALSPAASPVTSSSAILASDITNVSGVAEASTATPPVSAIPAQPAGVKPVVTLYNASLFVDGGWRILKSSDGKNKILDELKNNIEQATKDVLGKEDVKIYIVSHTDSNPVSKSLTLNDKIYSNAQLAYKRAREIEVYMYPDYVNGNQEMLVTLVPLGEGEKCAAASNLVSPESERLNRVDVYIMFGTDTLYNVDLCKQ